jgi:hypothetical protein
LIFFASRKVANRAWHNRPVDATGTTGEGDDDDDDDEEEEEEEEEADDTKTLLTAHASEWEAISTRMLSDDALSIVTAAHDLLPVVALDEQPQKQQQQQQQQQQQRLESGAAVSSGGDEAAKAARQRAIALSLIDKLVAQSDPIITHGMKGVLMGDGVAAHLLAYVSRHNVAAEQLSPEQDEIRAARSLTVARLFTDASPTFREFVQLRLRELLRALLVFVEVPGARGDFGHFKVILGELLAVSTAEVVNLFVKHDLLRLLDRADDPRVMVTITTLLNAGAMPSEQHRRAFYANVSDVGFFRHLSKSIVQPTRSSLREAHLELIGALLDEYLWTPQSEMLFVGLFKGSASDAPLVPTSGVAITAAGAANEADADVPGVVQQLGKLLQIATQRLGASSEPLAAPSPRSSSAAAAPDDFDDPALLRQRVSLAVGLLAQLADARGSSPPSPMGGAGGGGGMFGGGGGGGGGGRQPFGLSALGLTGHGERRHGLTRFEAQLKNQLRPCVTLICAILTHLAGTDSSRVAAGPLKLSAFTVQRPLGLYRLALIQSLTSLVKLDPPTMLPRMPQSAWATLTDAFFEYRFNSIYQRLYCDLVSLAVHANCIESLTALLAHARLLARIIERYEINAETNHQEDAQRGALLRVANLMRLRAAAAVAADDFVRLCVASEPQWANFETELRQVALADTRRLYETPRRLGGLRSLFGNALGGALNSALGGAFGALGLGMQDARSSYADEGIDLGSKFAYDLGFTLRTPVVQQPLTKKRRKDDKLLSGSESDDGEADDTPASSGARGKAIAAAHQRGSDGGDDGVDEDEADVDRPGSS